MHSQQNIKIIKLI